MSIRPNDYRNGVAAALAGDLGRASALLLSAAEHMPDDPRVWLWLAACAPTAAEATPRLHRALELDPTNVAARGVLGQLLVARGNELKDCDRLGACAALAQASELVPDDQSVWLTLRDVCDDEAARLGHMRRAMAAIPDSDEIRNLLRDDLVRFAIGAAREGRVDDARVGLREALVVVPTDVRVLLALAHVSEPDEAVDLLERALALEPSHPAATAALAERSADAGIAAFERGDAARATALLERAVALAPDNVKGWQALAEHASTTAKRIEYFRRVVALLPADGDATSALASLLADEAATRAAAGDQAETLKLYREVVTLDPASVQGWWGLASRATNDAEALDAASKVLALDARHADALELRARLTAPAPAAGAAERVSAAPAPPPAGPVPTVSRTGRMIMVIDDSPTIRKALTIILERAGHRVIPLADGEQAIAALDAARPDLVFLDITMPKMDGYEVCRQIRKRGPFAELPIVMLSGKDGFFDKVRGRMAGATEYITKPFEPPAVLAAIAEYCAR